MTKKEQDFCSSCIGCKNNNIVDIIKDYISKYNNPEELEKYNTKKENILSSIRFLATNIGDRFEYFSVLEIAIYEGTPEIINVILTSECALEKKQQIEIKSIAYKHAKKSKELRHIEIHKIIDNHNFNTHRD